MTFPINMIRGRKKGIRGNQSIVRRYIAKNEYERKHKNNNGQCRITIPRSIADLLGLKDRDIIEFKERKGDIVIEKVFGE